MVSMMRKQSIFGYISTPISLLVQAVFTNGSSCEGRPKPSVPNLQNLAPSISDAIGTQLVKNRGNLVLGSDVVAGR